MLYRKTGVFPDGRPLWEQDEQFWREMKAAMALVAYEEHVAASGNKPSGAWDEDDTISVQSIESL